MAQTTARKLKIKAGDTLLTLHAPTAFAAQIGVLPEAVTITSRARNYQQLHWFVTSKAQVEKEAAHIMTLLKEGVICWVYFPKGTSGMQTDLTRDKGWDALLAGNDRLQWLSLISFNDTWSAFALRLQTAGADTSTPRPSQERPILQYIDASSKTVRLPEDLALAFAGHAREAAYFNSLSFTNRKEYVEWIVTARLEATRKKRIEATLEKLAMQWKNPRNI